MDPEELYKPIEIQAPSEQLQLPLAAASKQGESPLNALDLDGELSNLSFEFIIRVRAMIEKHRVAPRREA